MSVVYMTIYDINVLFVYACPSRTELLGLRPNFVPSSREKTRELPAFNG